MAKPRRYFKFCTLVGHVNYQRWDDKGSSSGHGHGNVTSFSFGEYVRNGARPRCCYYKVPAGKYHYFEGTQFP